MLQDLTAALSGVRQMRAQMLPRVGARRHHHPRSALPWQRLLAPVHQKQGEKERHVCVLIVIYFGVMHIDNIRG
jgi:hypothetical protein